MARRTDHSRAELHAMALREGRFIIDAQGLAQLSMRKVAKRMGYAVGTLYLIFSDLDDLLVQINTQTLAELNAALASAAAAEPDPVRCIQTQARVYLDFAVRHTRRWSAIFEHPIDASAGLPADFVDHIALRYRLLEDALGTLCRDHSEQDAARAARALGAGVHGVCMLGLSDGLGLAQVESLAQVVDALVDAFVAGFSAQLEAPEVRSPRCLG
jgi:AcrR family transcriptional regulator